jgi:hypothetical protein
MPHKAADVIGGIPADSIGGFMNHMRAKNKQRPNKKPVAIATGFDELDYTMP